MSAMNIDRSLDDMVADKRKARSSRGTRKTGGGGGGAAGAKPATGTSAAGSARARYSGPLPSSNSQVNTRQAAAAAAVQAQAGTASEKIIVSNLPNDVNEAQIKELFTTTIGPLKDVTLHYDSAGKSKGVANVTFQRRGDGTKAYNEYNNRLIDGKRPMKVELIVDPTKVQTSAPATLASRVAPPKKEKKAAANDQLAGVAEAMQGVEGNGTRGGRRPGRGRGRGRGGRSKGGERPAKSVADLDAEMEDYTSAATSAAAAPAAAAAA